MAYFGSVAYLIKDIKDESQLLRLLSISSVLCALLALGMIIATTKRINAYGNTPTVVTEIPTILKKILPGSQSVLMASSMISNCIR